MLPPADRFVRTPYVPAFNLGHSPDLLSDDDPIIVDYVQELYGEDVERITPSLLNELNMSDAPFSSIYTACALTTHTPGDHLTSRATYLGHRTEVQAADGTVHTVTAVEMALGKIASANEKIDGVYLTGRDLPYNKLKRMLPIPTDYDHLAQRFEDDWGPAFILIPPNGQSAINGLRWVWASRHSDAYEQHRHVVLSRELPKDEEDFVIAEEIQERTSLSFEDATFAYRLMNTAIKNDWSVFLTGSASGVGEVTPALTDNYNDMDFMIVANQPEAAEQAIVAIAEQHYGQLAKVTKPAYDIYEDKSVNVTYYHTEQGKQIMQTTIGESLDAVCLRSDVIARNSGIWLHDGQQVSPAGL